MVQQATRVRLVRGSDHEPLVHVAVRTFSVGGVQGPANKLSIAFGLDFARVLHEQLGRVLAKADGDT
jgi:hypothetical protein